MPSGTRRRPYKAVSESADVVHPHGPVDGLDLDAVIRARTWVPWIIVVIVACAALSYGQSGAGRRLLRSAGLEAEAKRYVVFAFADVTALPYSVVTGGTVSLPVTIENHRGGSVVYTVSATGADAAIAHGRGVLTVANGARGRLNVSVSLNCRVPVATAEAGARPTAKVVLTLRPSGEIITHAMYCRAAA